MLRDLAVFMPETCVVIVTQATSVFFRYSETL